jgi:alkanesulfonate monooxygenase SsuD/methylene tetrahydromethanopterin reductase-like flavin-dependent oxidoreductase (luciferase family)
MVAATIFRNPALLAKQAITIDEISAGRLILGVGAGWHQFELGMFGYPGDRLVGRFEEAFTILRRLIRGEHVTFAGQYYSVRDSQILPAGPRHTGPELMVGSSGSKMLHLTLPYVDGWNGHWSWPEFMNQPERFAVINRRIDGICQEVGRVPGTVWRSATVFVQLKGATGAGIYKLPAEALPIGGSPSQLSERFTEFAESGVDHLQILLDPPTERSVEVIGDAMRRASSHHS